MSSFGESTKLGRRQVIQLASAALLGQSLPVLNGEGCTNSHEGAHDAVKPYTVQFFTPDEIKLLDETMEKIIPADGHSPGAHEAQVALFADLIVATSPNDVKEDWRGGLRLLAEELERSSVDEWLAKSAANERDPRTVLDLFFIKLKQMAVDGYYTSSIGIHQDMQYQGNTYLTEFKGCTHAEHQG
jgi:hypothetical protein